MTTRYAEVLGVGHVARVIGGKLDGVLVPLRALTRRTMPGTPLTPESLEGSGPLDFIYDPNNDAMQALVQGEGDIGPGERLYTAALYHFAGYEEFNGLTVPKISTLHEADMNVGIRGGVVAAGSFTLLVADSTKIGDTLSMGEDVVRFMPHTKELLERFQAGWPNYSDGIAETGTTRGFPFELKLEWVGSSAGVGTVSSGSFGDVGVFLLLSGKSEADELQALALTQNKVPFMPRGFEIWNRVTQSSRPMLLILSEHGRVLHDPLFVLAWVFFRKIGVL